MKLTPCSQLKALPFIIVAFSVLLSSSAFSEDHRERDHWHGEIRYFHEHDLNLWRGGHWYHGRHVQRDGWWWVVNNVWYFYPKKVAVVPDPYLPPTMTVQVQTAPPPAAPPVPAAPMQAPAAPQSWYYCNAPHGYYPYVTQCPGGWMTVPASPQAPPAQ